VEDQLTDGDVERGLRESLGEERNAVAAFLLYLGEFEHRRLFERTGHPTAWEYLRSTFGLVEGSIHYRLTAARLLRRFPQATEMLREGRLCMTGLSMLRDVLDESNVDDVLSRAAGCSKKELELLVATLQPRPEPAPLLRRLPSVAAAPHEKPPAVEPVMAPSNAASTVETKSVPAPRLTPISAKSRLLRIAVSDTFAEKLDRAKAILGHAIPDGDYEAVLSRALDALLEKHEKRSTPSVKPRKVKPPKEGSRHIPIEIERAVRQRDGNRCTWPMADGSLCGSTRRLQLDHIQSFALGGESTVENIRCLCWDHNQQHAREVYGTEHIERSIARKEALTRPDESFAEKSRAMSTHA